MSTPANAVAKNNHCTGRIERWPSKYRASNTVKMGDRYWMTVALAMGMNRSV